jgi:hypothetical protein
MDHYENLGVKWKTILEDFGWEDVDWIHQAQE